MRVRFNVSREVKPGPLSVWRAMSTPAIDSFGHSGEEVRYGNLDAHGNICLNSCWEITPPKVPLCLSGLLRPIVFKVESFKPPIETDLGISEGERRDVLAKNGLFCGSIGRLLVPQDVGSLIMVEVDIAITGPRSLIKCFGSPEELLRNGVDASLDRIAAEAGQSEE